MSLSSVLLCPPLACWVLAALAWGRLWCWVSVPHSDSLRYYSACPCRCPPPSLFSPHFPPPSPCIPRPPLCAHLPISGLLSSWPPRPFPGSPRVRPVGLSSGSSGAGGRRDGPANGEPLRSALAGARGCSRPSPHPRPRSPSWRPTPTCWRSPSSCPSSTVSLSSWPSRMVGVGRRAL